MLRDAVRNFLLVALAGMVLIGAGALMLHRAWLHQQMQSLAAAERESVHLASLGLRNHLRAAGQQFQALLGVSALRDVIERDDPSSVVVLARQYAVFMRVYRQFDQIRWIDSTGMERLRLDWRDGEAVSRTGDQLQNKSDRYYFKRAMALSRGAIYVSPLDLNVEHGRVEVPYKPVYRIAAPLFDEHGRRRGILIVNQLGNRLFDDIKSVLDDEVAARLMLVNQAGYWLRSPDPRQEWGFVFGKPTTLANSDVAAWRQISSQMLGQQWRDDGLWTWESNRPLMEMLSGVNPHLNGPVQLLGEESYLWTVLQRYPSMTLVALKRRDVLVLWLAIAALLLFSAGLAFLLTRSQFKVERLNTQLAKRVNDAESESQAKASFLANMSHEIRTPIAAILGLTYLLGQSRLSSESMTLVRKIEAAGRSLTSILNDILDLSKMDSSHLQILCEPFALDDVLDNVATLMTLNAANKPIALFIAPPARPLGRFLGDALRIQQVLSNLVGNAIKFTASGHVGVTVTVRDCPEGRLTLRFVVKDTGLGLSAEQQREIFAPFRQADESTTRRFGGTGLGLAICHRLVELMEGRIGVESVPGEGSEFWFELTLPHLIFDRFGEAMPRPHERILVVDDLAPSRAAWQAMAAALEWPLTTFATTEALLASLKPGDGPDIGADEIAVILDLKCPEALCFEQARMLRTLLAATQLAPRLILVHAREDARGALSEASQAFDAILTRPVTMTALCETLLGVQATASSSPAARVIDTEPSLTGVQVLVVDDNEINRDVAAHLLERAGATVILAGDGQTALDIMSDAAHSIALVLMDIQMPVMDGYEAIRRIRADVRFTALPIIALTAGVFQDQQARASAAGATLIMNKPFAPDDLIRKATEIVGAARGVPGAWALDSAVASTAVGKANHYPGLDLEMGRRLWHDEAKYRKYLNAFITDYAPLVTALETLPIAEIERVTHDIKGTAGNLALPEVAGEAAEINRLCKQGLFAKVDWSKLRLAMDAASASITRYTQ